MGRDTEETPVFENFLVILYICHYKYIQSCWFSRSLAVNLMSEQVQLISSVRPSKLIEQDYTPMLAVLHL